MTEFGKIPQKSIEKVERILRDMYPKAISIYSMRIAATILDSSSKKILDHLVQEKKVEQIETTAGNFWRWRGNCDGG